MANGPISTRTGSITGNGMASGMARLLERCVGRVKAGAGALSPPRFPAGAVLGARAQGEAHDADDGTHLRRVREVDDGRGGVAQGVRREAESVVRSQAERILRELDYVTREEFEAVKEMATKAREENDRLRAQLDALEARLASQ